MDFDYLKSKWHVCFPTCIPFDGMVLKTEYFSSAFPLSNAEGRLREFKLINGEFTRDLAVNECRTNYTDLATVYDQQDNIKLRTLLINVTGYPSGWIGAQIGSSSKKWSNGDEVTYKNDFNMECEETLCAAMKSDGNWESLKCTYTRHFMCYKQGNKI